MAAPMVELNHKIKIFKKMSREMQVQFLHQITDPDEKKALKELMEVGNFDKFQGNLKAELN